MHVSAAQAATLLISHLFMAIPKTKKNTKNIWYAFCSIRSILKGNGHMENDSLSKLPYKCSEQKTLVEMEELEKSEMVNPFGELKGSCMLLTLSWGK